MKLDINKYTIEYTVLEKLVLPEYSGSTFRGVFGHALKQLSCINMNEDCSICQHSKECIYSLVFETKSPENDIPPFPGMNYIPHPFILRPGKKTMGHLRAGDVFSLELNIYGRFIDWSHYFLKALQNTGKIGAGKGKGKFRLNRIVDRASGNVLYRDGAYFSSPVTETLSLNYEKSYNNIQMQIITMLRFVKNRRMVDDLTPEILFKEGSRRFRILVHYYGQIDDEYDYRSIIESAKTIRFQNNLSVKKISRYSNRRNKYINIDGLIGNMFMEGVPPQNYALLKVLEETHLGKSTVMGIGYE